MDFVQDIDCRELAICSKDAFLRWNGSSWDRFRIGSVDDSPKLSFSSSSQTLAIHDWGRGLRVLDLDTGKLAKVKDKRIERLAATRGTPGVLTSGKFEGVERFEVGLRKKTFFRVEGSYKGSGQCGKIFAMQEDSALVVCGSELVMLDLQSGEQEVVGVTNDSLKEVSKLENWMCVTIVLLRGILLIDLNSKVCKVIEYNCFTIECLHASAEDRCFYFVTSENGNQTVCKVSVPEGKVIKVRPFQRGHFAIFDNYNKIVPYNGFCDTFDVNLYSESIPKSHNP